MFADEVMAYLLSLFFVFANILCRFAAQRRCHENMLLVFKLINQQIQLLIIDIRNKNIIFNFKKTIYYACKRS